MVQRSKQYDYSANKKLNNYVRLKYQNQLSNGALHVYLLAMPYLEEKQSGFCQQVTANYDELGQATCRDYSGMKNPLLELKGVLCEVVIGKPIKGGKKATVIRRYNLQELKEKKLQSKIIDKSPAHAQTLAKILESRSFIYGDNLTYKPYWDASKTGRVVSHKPNVQGDSKNDRAERLRHGLLKGQFLFDLDIKQAEPSIIQQVLKYKFPSDPYQMLADVSEFDRKEAKQKINMLAYAISAVKIVRYWSLEAQEMFLPYAKQLDKYKAKLWESWKPKGKQRRFIDTLGGSRVYADRGQRNNKGKILNWHIQGTVADIINTASLEIIQREQAEGWKFLFPEHDSIYVVGKNQHQEKLKQVIISKAKDLNLDLSVGVQSYVVGKTQ
ncbi:MAG: hypothetical protein FVQ82_02565 [Planctomycetes bacterium]|nr:hypothetical protein [Planctomycetota bacterium]